MADASPTWDPQQYSRFESQRDRAALDLLVRLPDDLKPREIWDLGCGAGQHAALLAMAEGRGLIPTGGSDYHGRNFKEGRDLGSAPVPAWVSDNPEYPRVDVYGSLEELEREGLVELRRP